MTEASSMSSPTSRIIGSSSLLLFIAWGAFAQDTHQTSALLDTSHRYSLPHMVRERSKEQKSENESTPPTELTRHERDYMSHFDPFLNRRHALRDPIDPKIKVDGVLYGEAFKARNENYDYFRYVTFYIVKKRKERVPNVPIQREQCHNNSFIFAGVDFTTTVTASFKLAGSLKAIGLEMSGAVSQAVTSRSNIQASGGLIADHIPYYEKEDWFGRTFIETYNSKTGKFAIITQPKQKLRIGYFNYPTLQSIENGFNPAAPMRGEFDYPMPFAVIDKQWTFYNERKVLEYCNVGLEEI